MAGLLHWYLDSYGVQVYNHADHHMGWLTTPCRCPACRHEWRAVAAVGATGIECPACHEINLSFVWWPPKDAEDRRGPRQ